MKQYLSNFHFGHNQIKGIMTHVLPRNLISEFLLKR